MNNILWKLFKNTVDLKYYLFMKEIEKDETGESKGNNN